MTSGTPAVSATSVSQTTSARRFLRGQHRRRGGGVVGLGAVRTHDRERLHQAAEMRRPARRRDALLQPAPVGEQPDPVAGRERHLRERQCGRHGSIQHRLGADTRAEETTGVDEQPHRLAALGLIDLGHELSTLRRRAPAHVAPLIAGTIVAQIVELPARAGSFRAALLDRDLTAANQVQGLPPALVKIRIDPDCLLQRNETPSLDETPRAPPLHDDAAHLRVSPLARRHRVFRSAVAVRRNGDRHLGQFRSKRSADVVRQADVDGDAAAVVHVHDHGRRRSKSQWPSPAARDGQLGR